MKMILGILTVVAITIAAVVSTLPTVLIFGACFIGARGT
jgi:hypothetical protein